MDDETRRRTEMHLCQPVEWPCAVAVCVPLTLRAYTAVASCSDGGWKHRAPSACQYPTAEQVGGSR